MDLITRTLALYIISCIVIISLQNIENTNGAVSNLAISYPNGRNTMRDPRSIIYKKKTGPIRQFFGLIYEQWNDTRFTYNTINELINGQFLPDNAPATTTTTPNPNPNVTTKAPPYRITRAEFARILRRNLRGLERLYNIELQEALKQSQITRREFNKNVTKEVAKFL